MRTKQNTADAEIIGNVIVQGATVVTKTNEASEEAALCALDANDGEDKEIEVKVYRDAMRNLAGGVSVITVGRGMDVTGFTASSVTSLSTNPPRVLVCINRGASSWEPLQRYQAFGVNILGADDWLIADRFAGRGGLEGIERYAGAGWVMMYTKTPILAGNMPAFDCEVEEVIERHDHAIIIGRVRAVRTSDGKAPLVYWQGDYHHLADDGSSSNTWPA